jgi:soluble lytic murein transglycosylase-like protein
MVAMWSGRAADFSGPARQVTVVVRPDARTGRLVRSRAVEPRPVPPIPVAPHVPGADGASAGDVPAIVEQTARNHDVDPLLVHSVIQVESNYNPYAISPKGAEGLMQLIPSTARRFEVRNPFDPAQNIAGGVRYLRYLLDLYDGNYGLALAAYNAGEAAVAKYNGLPPYPETQNYVEQVRRKLSQAQRSAQPANKKTAPEPVAAAPDAHRPIETLMDMEGRVYYRTR